MDDDLNEDDLAMLKEFAKENNFNQQEDEEVEIISVPKFQEVLKKYEKFLNTEIQKETLKEKECISKKNQKGKIIKLILGAQEAAENKKGYQKELLSLSKDYKNVTKQNIEEKYEKLRDGMTDIGVDIEEFENSSGKQEISDDPELDELEKDFGSELNELMGFEPVKQQKKPQPQSKKPVEKPKPKPVEKDSELEELDKEFGGEKEVKPKIEVKKEVISVPFLFKVIENYKIRLGQELEKEDLNVKNFLAKKDKESMLKLTLIL